MTSDHFKPQIYQGRGRQQKRNFNQRNYQDRNRLNNRSSSRDRGQLETGPGLSRIKEGNNFRGNFREYVDRIAEGTIEIMTIDIMITIEVGIGQGRGHYQGITAAIELAV